MTLYDMQRLLKICDCLNVSYRQYLDAVYSLDWKTLKETEQQHLAMITLGLQTDAKKITIQALEQEIKYTQLFWAQVEEEILPISFSYICWDLEQSEKIPCLLVRNGDVINGSNYTVSMVCIQQIQKKGNKEQEYIRKQILCASQENNRALLEWCERLYQVMHRYFDEYKNNIF